MGKLDAILATYASVYGAMKRKEKLVARNETRRHLSASSVSEIHEESPSSSSSAAVVASSSSSSAPEVPSTSSSGASSKVSPVNHLSVLRDTQRLWMSASAEHRAALEIIAESQYCRGIYPQLRQRLPHVPQYCTMTLNYPDDDTNDDTTNTDNPSMDDSLKKKYNKYQDPSKKFALRLPLYKEAMFRKEPISMDFDDDDNDDGDDDKDRDGSIDGGHHDTTVRKKKQSSSTAVKKKTRNKAYRMIRISKKEALQECLRRQPHVLRALQQAKQRPTRPLTVTAPDRPPLVFIDWTKVPRPTQRTAAVPVAGHTSTVGTSHSGNSGNSGNRRSRRRRPDTSTEEEEEESGSPNDEDGGDDSESQQSQTSGSQSDSHQSHSGSTGRSSRRRRRGRRSSSSENDNDEDDDEEDEEEINIL